MKNGILYKYNEEYKIIIMNGKIEEALYNVSCYDLTRLDYIYSIRPIEGIDSIILKESKTPMHMPLSMTEEDYKNALIKLYLVKNS